MSNLLAARFADVPVMVSLDRATWLGDCLAAVSAELGPIQTRLSTEPARMQDDFWPEEGSWLSAYRPYQVSNGTLLIPVRGMLLHGFGYQLYDWATGYPYIRKAVERGMADPAVERIAFVINSGGGEVAGNFDMVDGIYAFRGQKPMLALVDEHAYSAAYSIASVADKIVVTRTGGVGSIGVVTSHLDASAALDRMGYKITFIHAGAHKVDGNPYSALPEAVKNRMQARIDGLYDIFVSTVARNLGLSAEAIRGTEALTYSAEEAVALGLAHEIAPADKALAAFAGSQIITVGEAAMSQENQQHQATGQADLEAARAEGRKEGAQAERERIQGILGCDEATGRRDLAFHLALNTDQSVEVAKGILGATPAVAEKPAEKPEAKGADFQAAMAKGNPELGADGGEQADHQDAGASLIANYKAVIGQK